MILTAVYYVFIASAVLVYGIGLNTVAVTLDSMRVICFSLAKILFTVLTSAILTWLITKYILSPLNAAEVYPLLSLIILFLIFIFVDFAIKIKNKGKEFEFSVSFLIVILTVNECITLISLIIVSLSCIASFFVLLYVIRAVRNRLNIAESSAGYKNLKTILLLSIAVIIISIAAGNVSWLNNYAMR